MSFKIKENMNCLPILHALINDDSILDIEMGSLAKNINKEVFGVCLTFVITNLQ